MNIFLFYIYTLECIFDLLLLKQYLNISLKNIRTNSKILYYSCFILYEVILNLNMQIANNQHSVLRSTITIFVSIICTYTLCLLYDASNSVRILSTLTFQFIAMLGEMLSNLIFINIADNLTDNINTNLDIMIVFVSKFFMLILISISRIFWNKKNNVSINKIVIFQLCTPILMIMLSLSIPVEFYLDNKSRFFLSFFTAYAFIICFYTFWIFEKNIQNEQLKQLSIISKQQLEYQKEKYTQLSLAYKDTRKLIHDTKNHFFYLENCIKNSDTDKILQYIETSISSLENSYITTNTGNLVIDSLVSNLIIVCKNEHIDLETDISVDNQSINIDDFEVCIILGNLIDNAVNATIKIPQINLRKIYIRISTTEDNFIVHVINNFIPNSSSDNYNNNNSLYHGYGLSNIDDVVTKYNGIFVHEAKASQYISTVIMPLCFLLGT